MGKKSKASPTGPAVIDEANVSQIAQLKDDGNKHFGRKEYQKALESYEKALKLTPESHPDSALLHSNRAACFMMFKRFKEAVKECTAALDTQPGYHKALIRRAKAYEHMGQYKQALSDIQKVNKTDSASQDTAESEKRLRDAVAGKRAAQPNGAPQQQQARNIIVQAKCTLDNETRVVHMNESVSYAELLEAVRAKFPGSGPVILKYLDREGDLVTITERSDLHKAIRELVEHSERMGQLSRGGAALMPPLRIQVIKAASEDDVPKPPELETLQVERIRAAVKAHMQQQQQQMEQQTKKEEGDQQVYEVEEWLVDFANLFREQLNIDPERHLDLHALGYEKCTQALDLAVQSDKALPLFKASADKFMEVTITGLFNWGNIHVCLARRLVEQAQAQGTPLAQALPLVFKELDEAEKRYKQALEFKGDFYDVLLGMSALELERAKLKAGFVQEAVKPPAAAEGSDKPSQEAADAFQKASQEATAAALKGLQAGDVQSGQPHFDSAQAWAGLALEAAPALAESVRQEQEERAESFKAAGQDPPAFEPLDFVAHVHLNRGNQLFEWSQVLSAVGVEGWTELVAKAVEDFRAAKCPDGDIRTALLAHTHADQLGGIIPPEPEPKAEEAPEVKAEEKAEEVPKGLPALGKPKGKKADA